MWPGVGRGRVWLDEKTSRTCWTRRRTSRGIAGEFDDVKGAEHPATLSSRSSLATPIYALIKLLRLLIFVRGRCQTVSGCWGQNIRSQSKLRIFLKWLDVR